VECIVTEINEDERGLRDLLDSTMTDIDAPTARIEREARAQGARIRSRRRSGGLVGLAAGAAIAALALPSLAHGLGGGGSDVAADPSSMTPSPAATSPWSSAADGWWAMPAPEMLDRLTRLLPAGLTVTDAVTMNDDRAPGEPHGPLQGWLSANVQRSATDQGGVNLVFYPPPSPTPAPSPVTTTDANGDEHTSVNAAGPSTRQLISCPGNLVDPAQCTELRDADGHHYGRKSVSRSGGVTVDEVTIEAADGGVVYVAAANTTYPKWGDGSTVTADRPLLDLAQLETIAADPTWQDWTPPASASPTPAATADPTDVGSDDTGPLGGDTATPTQGPTTSPQESTAQADPVQTQQTSGVDQATPSATPTRVETSVATESPTPTN